MEIPAQDIKTPEVLDWQGLHLLHYALSSCSQKVRILLSEKGVPWVSHPVNLARLEQRSDWFRGINPNGVVPVLIHDGRVYVESNDILRYIEKCFPSPQGSWFPSGVEEERHASELLQLEADLHRDLRAITFTYIAPGKLMGELVSADEVAHAVKRFDQVLKELDVKLQATPYLCGQRLTLVDIAWFISVHRAVLSGYPLWQLPHIVDWYWQLYRRPGFRAEIFRGGAMPRAVMFMYCTVNRLRRRTMAAALAQQPREAASE